MSEHAIEFLQEWIGEKVHAPCRLTRIETQAESLAKECAAKAAEAGIPLEDIQEEVGDIQDLMTAKLAEAAEAAEPGQNAPEQNVDGDRNASAARTAENENTPSGKR